MAIEDRALWCDLTETVASYTFYGFAKLKYPLYLLDDSEKCMT